jgi:serine/threonine-protein kinase
MARIRARWYHLDQVLAKLLQSESGHRLFDPAPDAFEDRAGGCDPIAWMGASNPGRPIPRSVLEHEETVSMLGKLKEMFGPGSSTPGSVRRRRVNLQRRFTIVSETARGSMSRVYRALDNETGRTICLKVQHRKKNEAAAARASGQEARPLEGEMAIQLVHSHVVRTFEYGDSNQGEHYLVMEYVDGVSLQYIRESRSARTAQRVELLAQAAEGLAAVHAAGFIHHDINPRNFLVNREQQVKLIDFGLTVPNTPAFCRPGNRTGTLQYMAPELLRREPIDERIDIFAFGVLAFELLTDRLPYDANNSTTLMLQRINTEPLDPAVVKPKLSDEICEILRKLTSRRKEQRWAAMSTLPEALRSVPAKRPRASQ